MRYLDDFVQIRKKIFDYFGYVENWKVLPVENRRDMYWNLRQSDDGSGKVLFSEQPLTEEFVASGLHYEDEIYTQRHLSQWVYRAAEYKNNF